MHVEPDAAPRRRKVGITPLKARRLARGQTIREVAEATGIHKDLLARWEIGLGRPGRAAARTLASHFGIGVADLHRPVDVALAVDPATVDRIADRVADRVLARLGGEAGT